VDIGSCVLTLAGKLPIAGFHSLADREKRKTDRYGDNCNSPVATRNPFGLLRKNHRMRTVDTAYSGADFSKDITNVNASQYFAGGGWIEGAHSDFWHTETLHLITSVIDQVKS
jgi:hypothetical protein